MDLCIICLVLVILILFAGIRWNMGKTGRSLGEYKNIREVFTIGEDFLLQLPYVRELRLGEMSKPLAGYLKGRIYICLISILTASLIGLLSGLTSSESIIGSDNTITRNSYGKGDKSVTLAGEIEGESQEYEIKISERQYNEEEAGSLLKDCIPELDKLLLGDNESFDEIVTDINPVSSLKDGLVTVVWHFSDYEIIDGNGHIQGKQLRKRLARDETDSICLIVSGVLSYRDYEEKYERSLYLKEPRLDSREALVKALQDSLEEKDEESVYEDSIILPQEVDGRQIIWSEPVADNGGIFLLLGLVAGIGICFGRLQEEKKRKLIREQQIEGDYPEFVSKLTLMLSAGMSFHNAWDRIGDEYKAYKERNPGYNRYLYEEMIFTSREIQGGLSIRDGIENFCGRIKLPSYKRFGTLLLQSMDKGMDGLCKSLDYEVMQAFQEKKARTKILGEEASTKLLLPMGILLFIVLIIIIAPAFMSMGV